MPLKASELRTGNVIWDDTREKVKWVNHRVISDLASENNPLPYSPIHLTEEWLLKFGFELSDHAPVIQHICFSKGKGSECLFLSNGWMLIESDLKGAYMILSRHCHYVHELQNLYYALTGTELC